MSRSNGSDKGDPRTDPTSIGNILIDMGYITPAELDRALRDGVLLGEALRDTGIISEPELRLALLKQRAMRGERVEYGAVQKAMKHLHTLQARSLSSIDRVIAVTEAAVKVAEEG